MEVIVVKRIVMSDLLLEEELAKLILLPTRNNKSMHRLRL